MVVPTLAAPGTASPDLADPLADPAVATTSVQVEAGAKTPGDPLETFNRSMFRRHQRFDRTILRPAAMGYKHAVPEAGA